MVWRRTGHASGLYFHVTGLWTHGTRGLHKIEIGGVPAGTCVFVSETGT